MKPSWASSPWSPGTEESRASLGFQAWTNGYVFHEGGTSLAVLSQLRMGPLSLCLWKSWY